MIAQGFCGFHHHQVSGLTIGNDGWLYITSGDNDNYVEGSDGSRATVLRTGAVFRCRPDGSKNASLLDRLSQSLSRHRLRQCLQLVPRRQRQRGRQQVHRLPAHARRRGSDFGWRLFAGGAVLPARSCARCRLRRAARQDAGYAQDRPRLAGRPADLQRYAIARVLSRLLLLSRCVPQADPGLQGGTRWLDFRGLRTNSSSSRANDPLFRPCQMVSGPTARMYICDWRTDSGGAGKLWGDNVHGRIYRVRWVGGSIPGGKEEGAIALCDFKSWTRLPELSDEELIKSLGDESFTIRVKAQDVLRLRGDKNRQALLTMLNDKEQPFRARVCALGVLQSFWNDEVRQAFLNLLKEQDFNLRKLAAEGLGLNAITGDKEVNAALMKHLSDPDLPVRRATALAMGRINAEGGSKIW